MRSVLIAAAALQAWGCGSGPSRSASPGTITLVAPAAPGGGWDQTARAMQQVLRDGEIANAVQVVNVPGAGGVIGWQVIETGAQLPAVDDLRADEAEAAWAVDALHLLPRFAIALEQGRRGGELQFVVVHEQVSALAMGLGVKCV